MKMKLFIAVLALLVLPSVVLAAENCTKEGGKDYYKAGTSIVGSDKYPDQCSDEKNLIEYYCDDKSLLEYEYYTCPVSCVDGACSGTSGTNETTNQSCVETWLCTDWSACLNGQQPRTCIDQNSCGTTVNKPAETQGCTPTTPPVVTPPSSGFAKYRWYIIGGIVVLIILYFALRGKKPKVKETPESKEDEK